MARALAFAVSPSPSNLRNGRSKNRVASGRPIIALERGHGLARHIIPAGGEIGIHRIAEILHAAAPVGEVRDPQVPPAAMAGGDGAKRLLRLADDVETPPQSAPAEVMGTGRVHGEVTGVADPLALIERAGPREHDGRDLTVAPAHMGLEPGGNPRPAPQARRSRRRARSGRQVRLRWET